MAGTTVEAAVGWIVGFCVRRAWPVALGALVGTVLLGAVAAGRLGMDTDVEKLIAADLPWRQSEIDHDRLFPQSVDLLAIVVDGIKPELAEEGAAQLAERLRTRPDLFLSVRRPDAGPFFERYGVLFLPVEEVRALAERIIEMQPLIGSLAADPSARGLFTALALLFEGVERGQADIAAAAGPLEAIAGPLGAALEGRIEPLSWRTLLSDRPPLPEELRRVVLAQPVLDFSALQAGAGPGGFVRSSAQALGLTPENGVRVRLTGSVALNDEEFATISHGAGLSLVLSVTLVLGILFLAVRSWRLIVPIMATLTAGLAATAAFASVTVRVLNPISVAFAVMFIGIAVDFGIQICVRYRDLRHRIPDSDQALRATGRELARPLLLAAATMAAGFLAFVPTAYVGVSQLGLIAGAGMLIAVLLNLTLMPALLTLLPPAPEPEPAGFAAAAALDRALLRHRGTVLAVAALATVAGVAQLPRLGFDLNPLNLKDPDSESVATVRDLMANPLTNPFTATVLTPSPQAAAAVAECLGPLPEVAQVLSINAFVPEQQEAKLALLADAALMAGPTLPPSTTAPPPTPDVIRAAALDTARRLSALTATGKADHATLASLLERLGNAGDAAVRRADAALTGGLPAQLRTLAALLTAGPVTLDTLPPDLRRDWVAEDGTARVEVYPTGDMSDNATLLRFVDAVRTVAPDATGPVVWIGESGRTVRHAFLQAAGFALVSITILLAIVLRRVWDVVLVVAPLLLALLLTLDVCVLIRLPLNFANVIALPLLLGIGVAFNIYFVVNWRAGQAEPLASPTARAVTFSALTTGSAFGTLALSSHPGTASMGLLLTIALGCTLLTTLLVLPALMGPVAASRTPR